MNAAIDSCTISDYIYYMRHKGLALQPQMVMINFYSNDLVDLKNWKKPKYVILVEEQKFDLLRTLKLMNWMRLFRPWEMEARHRR